MQSVLLVFIGVALTATLGVLAAGFISVASGGAFNRKYGNILMRARIGTQGVTVLLMLLYALTTWL
jgi:hypothetical protein